MHSAPGFDRPRPPATGLATGRHPAPAGSAYLRGVQRRLNRLLALRLPPTGWLDAPTRFALRTFQRQQGLPATGRLGPATRRALDDVAAFTPIQQDQPEYFLGGLGRGIARAAKSAGRAASAVARVVPLAQLASAASRALPFATAARAVWGGVAAGLAGKNVLHGAVRAALPTALGRFAFDAGRAALRGENLARALQQAGKAGINDVREQLRFVQMVAPFVPGVGSGVAAALGAANALAEGRPITQALVAAARGALPGGVAAQAAFDTALNLAQGKKLGAAVLEASRQALPGGPLARAAFDTAVAIAEGQRLQDAGIAAARKALPGGAAAQLGFDTALALARGKNPGAALLAAARTRLPGAAARVAFDATVAAAKGQSLRQVATTASAGLAPGGPGLQAIQAAASKAATRVFRASPYAADALSFAKAAARGQNMQSAALTGAGQRVLARVAR